MQMNFQSINQATPSCFAAILEMRIRWNSLHIHESLFISLSLWWKYGVYAWIERTN